MSNRGWSTRENECPAMETVQKAVWAAVAAGLALAALLTVLLNSASILRLNPSLDAPVDVDAHKGVLAVRSNEALLIERTTAEDANFRRSLEKIAGK